MLYFPGLNRPQYYPCHCLTLIIWTLKYHSNPPSSSPISLPSLWSLNPKITGLFPPTTLLIVFSFVSDLLPPRFPLITVLNSSFPQLPQPTTPSPRSPSPFCFIYHRLTRSPPPTPVQYILTQTLPGLSLLYCTPSLPVFLSFSTLLFTFPSVLFPFASTPLTSFLNSLNLLQYNRNYLVC